MKLAYIRVSTTEQNTARQDIMMKNLGITQVFEEHISGKNTERPQLQKMLAYIQPDDIVYVESFSRLARSTKDLLGIVEQLSKKGVGLVSLKENFDTSSPQGKFVLTIFAALAELERETILQRQAEGIAAAKAAGKTLGRHKRALPLNYTVVMEKLRKGEISGTQAIKELKISRSTFYRLQKEKAPD